MICERRGKDSGQALVELALILPVILVFLLGTVETGRIFHGYLVVTSAAREGARAGAVGGDDLAILEAVRAASGSLIAPEGVQASDDIEAAEARPDTLWVQVVPADSLSRVSGSELEVRLKGAVDLVAPLLSDILSDPFPVTASAVMRIE